LTPHRETPDVESRQTRSLETADSQEQRLQEWSDRILREMNEKNQRIQKLESGIIQRNRRLERQDRTIAELEKKLEEMPRHIARLQYDLIQIRISKAWKLACVLDRYLFIISFFKLFYWTITGKIFSKRREEKRYAELKNSGLFDPEYYLMTNPDVAEAEIDPLQHYIDNYREGRNPNPNFDTLAYLREHPEIDIHPLLHYSRTEKSPQ
jgi:hypothetical protein